MATEILNRVLTLDIIYPVGSLYFSTTSTNPAQMFGGTWAQIKGQFIYACEDSGIVAGSTGGAKQVSYTPQGGIGNTTLTVNQIPSHNHSFTGSSVNTGNNSVGHTHTYTDYYATTTGNTAITVAQMPSHNHGGYTGYTQPKERNQKFEDYSQAGVGFCSVLNSSTPYIFQNFGIIENHRHSITANGSGNNHNHSGANTSTSRTSNGISANHSHSVTASGSIGNKGGGGAHNHTFSGTAATINTMPPYLAVYVWKRTA